MQTAFSQWNVIDMKQWHCYCHAKSHLQAWMHNHCKIVVRFTRYSAMLWFLVTLLEKVTGKPFRAQWLPTLRYSINSVRFLSSWRSCHMVQVIRRFGELLCLSHQGFATCDCLQRTFKQGHSEACGRSGQRNNFAPLKTDILETFPA
jgi:hypothetical protein